MNKKIWIGIGGVLSIAVLAAAVYLAVSLIGQGQSKPIGLNLFGSGNSGIAPVFIHATQQPAREPDLWYGEVVEVKDHSIFVTPIVKSQEGQNLSQVEVVTVNATEVYRDTTNFGEVSADNKIYWAANTYPLHQIKSGDNINVWGSKRGDRLVADVIMVYVCRNAEDGSGYNTPYHPVCGTR